MLNPFLRDSVGRLRFGKLWIPPRPGHPNPPVGLLEKRFLRRFTREVSWKTLTSIEQERAKEYVKRLFLLRYGLADGMQ